MASRNPVARQGARQMIAAALEEEVAAYIERHRGERSSKGTALVVRNGRARPRDITVGSGPVEIRAPRVNDKRVDENGERRRFSSEILPRYARRSPRVEDVLPTLYLHGLSTGDFQPALESLPAEERPRAARNTRNLEMR
jgi:putative transposase